MASSETPYLYRILSYRHVLDLFETGELHFTPPNSWDDPYEQILRHKDSHLFFAQCWCKRAVSDAMWRIYSPDRTALRIRSTRSKLTATLENAKDQTDFGYLINDVQYMSARKVKSHISEVASDLRNQYSSRRAADALLVKRDAFDHEAEVRILLNDKSTTDKSKPKSALRINVDPHALIDSVYFDPRAEDAFVQMCTHYLKTSIKFNGLIGKSALYRSHEQVVVE